MRIEIQADLVIPVRFDIPAGSQLVVRDGRIVAVLPPPAPPRDEIYTWASVPEPEKLPATVSGSLHGGPPIPRAEPETPAVATPTPAAEPVAKKPAKPVRAEPEMLDQFIRGLPKTPGIITNTDVLNALRKGPNTARRLTAAFEAHGMTGSVKNRMKSLRLAGMVVALDQSRFPLYGISPDAVEQSSPDAVEPSEPTEQRPVRPITKQMILDTLEDTKALSVVSIAKSLDIEQHTPEWSRLVGTAGSMVKHGDLKKIESQGMMLLGLPEFHQAS